jgi:hypothetical protein
MDDWNQKQATPAGYLPMSRSTRHFLVEDGRLRPIAGRTLYDLKRRDAALPQYAGHDLHVLDVAVEVARGKPARIREIGAETVALDAHGWIKSELAALLRAALRGAHPGKWRPSSQDIARARALALGRAKSLRGPPRATRPQKKPVRD